MVVGIDRSAEVVAEAEATGPADTDGGRPSYAVDDVYGLSRADESFDVVTQFDVLEHLDDDLAALEEARRVLTPGGLLLLSVPAHPILWSSNDEVAGHRRRYRRSQLARRIGESGLHPLRLTYANALLSPPIALWLLGARALRGLGLRSRGESRTNLSWTMPAPVNELLYRAFTSELPISRRLDLPFGHSLVAVLQRRELGVHTLTPARRRRTTGVSRRVFEPAT